MARPLNVREIKTRIKANKILMKSTKKAVSDAMAAGIKGDDIDASETRKCLAEFIKAAKAVQVDGVKLESVS